MEAFNGTSGAFYVRNPFGAKDYVFAKHESKATYGKKIPLYVSAEFAYSDCVKASEQFEEWEIRSPGKIENIKCDLTGQMETGNNICNYLQTLADQYGHEQIKATKCLTTTN